jgi:hypothetical protein
MEAGAAVGEGPEIGVEAAALWTRSVDVGLDVPPTTPPQPAKKNTMRDKQINEKIPEARSESWRRIDYLSAILR